jgi:hypothetical protein
LICSGLLVFLVLPDANAKTSRHRKRAAFSVVLQPFSLVHSVVHAVAATVVAKAPRILRAAATAPIRVAYYKPRRIKPRVPRGERVDDYDQKQDSESNQQIERRGDRPMVAGKRAVLRNGVAYAPSRAQISRTAADLSAFSQSVESA